MSYTISSDGVATGSVEVYFPDGTSIDGVVSDSDVITLGNIVGADANVSATSINTTDNKIVFNFTGELVDQEVLISPQYLFLSGIDIADDAGNTVESSIDPSVVEYVLGQTILSTGFNGYLNGDAQTIEMSLFGVPDGSNVKLTIADDNSNSVTKTGSAVLADGDQRGSVSFNLLSDDLSGFSNGDVSYSVVVLDGNGDEIASTKRESNLIFDAVVPVFTDDTVSVSIEENSSSDTVLFSGEATDTSPLTYSLLPEDQKYFSINAATGDVTIASVAGVSVLDHESIDVDAISGIKTLVVTVIATDAAGNKIERDVSIDVSDVDESKPVFDQQTLTLDPIDENSGAEQEVYRATDHVSDTKDIDDNTDTSNDLIFDFKSDDLLGPIGDASLFTIDPDTGVVTLDANPNYEGQSEYTFTVTATDQQGNVSEQVVNLSINDLVESNDITAPNFVYLTEEGEATPVEIDTQTITIDVTENVDVSGWSYVFQLDDPESVVSLTGTNADLFNLIPSDAVGEGLLATLSFKDNVGSFDYEVDPNSYQVTLNAVDNAGNNKALPVTFAVQDVQNPVFASSNTITVLEGEKLVGETLLTLSAAGEESDTVSYSLVSQEGDNELVGLDPSTGEIFLLENLDYESSVTALADHEYEFLVRASTGQESTDQVVTLNINNVSLGPSVTDVTWDVDGVALGDSVPIQVTFSAAVRVTGTPVLRIVDSDTKGAVFDESVSYTSGTETNTLTFMWTLPEGLNFTDLAVEVANIELPSNSVTINGVSNVEKADLGFSEDLSPLTLNTVMPAVLALDASTAGEVELRYSESLVLQTGSSIELRNRDFNSNGPIASYQATGDETTDTFVLTMSAASIDVNDPTLYFSYSGVEGSVSGNTPMTYIDDSDNPTITPAAGRFITNQLILQILDEEGQLISESDFDPISGQVRFSDVIPSGYTGTALIRLLDANGKELDYLDEFTNQLTDFSAATEGFGLRAIVDTNQIDENDAVVVSPVSELIVRLIDRYMNADYAKYQSIVEEKVAQFFGMSADQNVLPEFITDESFDFNDGVTAGEQYGLSLAVLSVLDGVTGSINQTLSLLVDADPNQLSQQIERAISSLDESANPYLIDIKEEASALLNQLNDFDSLVSGLIESLNSEVVETPYLILDVDDFEEGEYELLIDGDIIDNANELSVDHALTNNNEIIVSPSVTASNQDVLSTTDEANDLVYG